MAFSANNTVVRHTLVVDGTDVTDVLVSAVPPDIQDRISTLGSGRIVPNEVSNGFNPFEFAFTVNAEKPVLNTRGKDMVLTYTIYDYTTAGDTTATSIWVMTGRQLTEPRPAYATTGDAGVEVTRTLNLSIIKKTVHGTLEWDINTVTNVYKFKGKDYFPWLTSTPTT